jgi:hypothetical protein
VPESDRLDGGHAAREVARRFAHELAQLRELRGNPSFEKMHGTIRHVAHVAGSRNTFHRMVTNADRIYEPEFVRGFVLALGLNDREADEWEQRRIQALQECQLMRDRLAAPEKPVLTAGGQWGGHRKANVAVIMAALVATLAAVLVVATIIVGKGPPVPGPDTGTRISARHQVKDLVLSPQDGADPVDSGCSLDPSVVVLDRAEVDYLGSPAGSDQLVYSPRCGVAWARFQPFPKAHIPSGAVIHVGVVRPDSHNLRMSFQAAYVGAPVYGNVLRSTKDCVYATATVEVVGKELPESHTHCFRGETPVATVGFAQNSGGGGL